MFGIEPTPFDLNFRLGRIPVRVHPLFWVVGALGGWYPEDLRFTFVWVLCLFVSILIHELGHALIAEAFGWPTDIVLYHFGGLAISQRYSGNTPWRSIAVSIAGPFAGFAFYAMILLAELGWDAAHFHMDHENRELIWKPVFDLETESLISQTFYNLKRINLWWGIVNLAPVLPLDGGHVCRSLLEWLRIRNYEFRTMQVSLVVGGAMAWYFLSHDERFAGMLFLFLAMQNFSSMQQVRGRW